jgi:hypothetical protein
MTMSERSNHEENGKMQVILTIIFGGFTVAAFSASFYLFWKEDCNDNVIYFLWGRRLCLMAQF